MIYQHIYTRCNRGYYSLTDGYDTAAKSADIPDNIARSKKLASMLEYPQTPGNSKPMIITYADTGSFAVYGAACEPSVKYGMNTGRSIYFFHQYICIGENEFPFDEPERMLLGTDFVDHFDDTTEARVLDGFNKLPVREYEPLKADLRAELGLNRTEFIRFTESVYNTVSGNSSAMLLLLDVPPVLCSQAAKRIMAVIELLLPPSLRRHASFCTFWPNTNALGMYKFVFSSRQTIVNTASIPRNIEVFDFSAGINKDQNVGGYVSPYAESLWENSYDKDALANSVKALDHPLLHRESGKVLPVLNILTVNRAGRSPNETRESFTDLYEYICACCTENVGTDAELFSSSMKEFCTGYNRYMGEDDSEKLIKLMKIVPNDYMDMLVHLTAEVWAGSIHKNGGIAIAAKLAGCQQLEPIRAVLKSDFADAYMLYCTVRFNACANRNAFMNVFDEVTDGGLSPDESMRNAMATAIKRIFDTGDKRRNPAVSMLRVVDLALDVNTRMQKIGGGQILDLNEYLRCELKSVDFTTLPQEQLRAIIECASKVFGNSGDVDQIKAMKVMLTLAGDGDFATAQTSYKAITSLNVRNRLNDVIEKILVNYDYPQDFMMASKPYCCALLLSKPSSYGVPSYNACHKRLADEKKSLFPFVAGVLCGNWVSSQIRNELTDYVIGMCSNKISKRDLNDKHWKRLTMLVKMKDSRLYDVLSSKQTAYQEDTIVSCAQMLRIADALTAREVRNTGSGTRTYGFNRERLLRVVIIVLAVILLCVAGVVTLMYLDVDIPFIQNITKQPTATDTQAASGPANEALIPQTPSDTPDELPETANNGSLPVTQTDMPPQTPARTREQ